jgi:hypothetical protein
MEVKGKGSPPFPTGECPLINAWVNIPVRDINIAQPQSFHLRFPDKDLCETEFFYCAMDLFLIHGLKHHSLDLLSDRGTVRWTVDRGPCEPPLTL